MGRLRRTVRTPSLGTAIALVFLAGPGCTRGSARPEPDRGGADSTPAQSATTSHPIPDVADYELTMDKLDAYFAASRNLVLAMKDMPKEEREALARSAAIDEPSIVDELTVKMAAQPALRDPIERAGLSVREYATIGVAFVRAALASAFSPPMANVNPDDVAAKMGTTPSNVRLLNGNRTAINEKMDALEADLRAAGLWPAEPRTAP